MVSARMNDACIHRAIFTEQLTAQVERSAHEMITVVATQELGPGDVLARLKEEPAQDEPRRGNNIVTLACW